MKKKQLIEFLNGNIFEKKEDVADFLQTLNKVVKAVAGEIELNDKVKLGEYFTIEKKHVEAKTGVAVGREYTTEAKDIIKITQTKAGKELV